MGIVADNRRNHAKVQSEKLRLAALRTCKCGITLSDHLEMLNGKCFGCMCKKWKGTAEDTLI